MIKYFEGHKPALLLPGPRSTECDKGADDGGDQHRGQAPPPRQVEQVPHLPGIWQNGKK